MLETIIKALPVIYVAITALPLLVIDLRQHRLPNRIILPMIAITFVSQFALAILTSAWATFGISVGLGLVVLLLGVLMNYKGIIGMGDVKLLVGLTMLLSSFTVIGAILLAPISFVLGCIVTIIILFKRSVTHLPIGPIVVATFGSILAFILVGN
jgi:leader peptidase (prepilin peptidase)/N-methyltransferase